MDGTTQNDSQRCVYHAWGYSKILNSYLYYYVVAFSHVLFHSFKKKNLTSGILT